MRLICPYCNTKFNLPEAVPGTRIACPRCGESFAANPTEDRESATEGEAFTPSETPRASSPSVWYVVGLLLILCVGVLIYTLTRQPSTPPDPTPVVTVPPATKPPALLAGVRLMPANTSVLLAIQPSPLLQYAERVNKDPAKLLAEAGLPPNILQKFGLPLEQIDHIAIGVSIGTDSPLSFSAVLVLRADLADDTNLRKELHAKANADRPGRYTVDIGWPMQMAKRDARTYLFCWTDKELDGMLKQQRVGVDHLRLGLRDSLQQLSPASFAWVATDADDWAKNPLLQTAAKISNQPELPKKLEGIRAAAVTLSIEPDLQWQLWTRGTDAPTVTSWNERIRPAVTTANATTTVNGDWLSVRVPFDPPQDMRKLLQKLVDAK